MSSLQRRYRRLKLTGIAQSITFDSIETSPFDQAVAAPARSSAMETPSAASQRGLDWFSFFLADIQTGFGPLIAVYLTANAWSQVDIGVVLSVGGLVALAGQMPSGALVDAARSTRLVAMLAIGAISASALALAAWPIFPVVLAARMVHAGASCMLGPAIAAMSLALVGRAALGERIGRNSRFAAIGGGIGAMALGLCGQFWSIQAVFVFVALLIIPAVFALTRIRAAEVERPCKVRRVAAARTSAADFRSVLTNRSLLIFAACVVLFHLSNAAMLPIMGSLLTTHGGHSATTLIAICMVVPQLIVAAASPWIGRKTQSWGRRPLLVACFAALALRGTVFALVSDPYLIVTAQILDGISAAILAIMFPLVIADITGDSGRFNLTLGIVGSAMGIGAAASTTMAGYVFDHAGSAVTFFSLSAIAAFGLVVVWLAMPETRTAEEGASAAS